MWVCELVGGGRIPFESRPNTLLKAPSGHAAAGVHVPTWTGRAFFGLGSDFTLLGR